MSGVHDKRPSVRRLLDIESWRVASKEELRAHMELVLARAKGGRSRQGPPVKGTSVLGVRRSLSPVDVYCYLKARFGEPNGFQNFLRRDHSDNWIHWDYNLKAGAEDVYICSTSREIHFILSTKMSDDDWRELISAIKRDFKRVGNEKSTILDSLEKWVIFPNKFAEIAAVCAELHADIVNSAGSFRDYKTPSARKGKHRERKAIEELLQRLSISYRSSLELSLLTPVLAEAFVNMAILILCKLEVRNNKRQFEAFMRSNIDAKLFDLAYKCNGFVRPIDQHSDAFKNFKRVMDKRNHNIHGNSDPEKEQLETVYFEGTRPLFKDPGDHIAKFLERRERQYQPEVVIKEYEDTHTFLTEIVGCLDPTLVDAFRRIIEDNYPGYDIRRKKMGGLFPSYLVVGKMQGMRYDDELGLH